MSSRIGAFLCDIFVALFDFVCWLIFLTFSRRRHKVKLYPKKDLVANSPSQDFNWKASGDDPQFQLVVTGGLPGWYMVELKMSHDQFSAAGKIYFDFGDGYDEEKHTAIPIKQGQVSKRLIYLPFGVKSIRFDPLQAEGRFSIDSLVLVWLTPHFAWNKILSTFSRMRPEYLDLCHDQIVADLKEAAIKVDGNWKVLAVDKYEELFRHASPAQNYSEWIKQNEVSLGAVKVKGIISGFEVKPIVSIVLPVYNANPELLKKAMSSVACQSYPNWELCIADDASSNPDVLNILRQFERDYYNIKVVYRAENGHICNASNSALALASGDFVGFMDHDDELHADALLNVVIAINQNRCLKFIYSDEDKINEFGERFLPHFKSGWNPDLLYSQNYVCHFSVFERNRLMDIGGFREGFEGSQDHDLILRFTVGLTDNEIFHIPKVLYHWRAVAGSTALDPAAKSYTQNAGEKAVQSVVILENEQAEVTAGKVPNSYRVKWPLPAHNPKVSMIIPTRDKIELLRPCINAILERSDYTNYEIIIINNQSQSQEAFDYFTFIQGLDHRVKVLDWDFPFNYSKINNFGVANAEGSIIGLINNDIEPIGGEWLTEMVSQVSRMEIGCVGAMLYYPDDTVQHAGVVLGIGGVAGHSHKYYQRGNHGYFSRMELVQNYSAVTGACLFVRKSVFEQAGGLNSEHLAVAFNDVDFCLKVKALGYRNLWTPYAEAYHHESVSRGGDDTPEKRARFQSEIDYMRATWGEQLDADPYYNPNLSRTFEDFSLGFNTR